MEEDILDHERDDLWFAFKFEVAVFEERASGSSGFIFYGQTVQTDLHEFPSKSHRVWNQVSRYGERDGRDRLYDEADVRVTDDALVY